MKTRKTKKRNIIRRAVAFLLCMTMVLGLGMQDVIEQVYAEEASAVSEQSADVPETQEAESTETTTPEEEPTGSEETALTTQEEEPTAPEEDKEPTDPANPADPEENTDVTTPPTETTEPSAPAEPTTPADGTENTKPTEPAAPETPADSNGSGSSDDMTPGGGTGTDEQKPPVEEDTKEETVSELAYAAEDGSFSVKAAAVSEDVNLSGIEIHASQVQKDSEEYAAAEELVAGALDAESRQIGELQAYDIWFTHTENGETADLSGQVQISLEYTAPEFPEGTDAQLEVFCLNGGTAEAVDGTDALAAGCELYALAWAVPAESTDTWEWTDGQVIIKASAEKGVLPEGAEISVTPIVKTEEEELANLSEEERAEAEAINEQYAQTEEKLTEDLETQAAEEVAALSAAEADTAAVDAASDSEETADDVATAKTLEGFLAYDICFLVNGEEVEPADGEVNVSIEFNEAVIPEGVSEDAEVSVAHLKEEKDEIVVEDLTTAETTTVETTEKAEVKKVELVTESFSTFTIVWTGTSWLGDNLTVTGHYVYWDEETQKYEEIPDNVYKHEEIVITQTGRYDLSEYVAEIPGYAYQKTTVNNAEGEEITALVASSSGSMFDKTYFIKYLPKNGTDPKDWMQSGWGEKNTGDIYYVYQASELQIKDNIRKEGTLDAVYSGDQTVASYEWYWSDSRDGEYQLVEKKNFVDGSSNLSEATEDLPGAVSLYPAYDGGAQNWYKVKAVFSDGNSVESAPYQVPYYDELQNGSFEIPKYESSSAAMNQVTNDNYKANGGVWQSTGEGLHNGRTVNIEILYAGSAGAQQKLRGDYHWEGTDVSAADREQFAELNAEDAGALYQDVLTVPGQPLYYSLSHRARGDHSGQKEFDTMYLVIMPADMCYKQNPDGTETEITSQEDLDDLLTSITDKYKPAGNTPNRATEEKTEAIYEENGILIYQITSDDQDWHNIAAEVYTPTSSLTRFFFMSGATATGNQTIGNFVDHVYFDQDLPEVSEDQFTLVLTKKFEGLDDESLRAVINQIRFNISVTEIGQDGSQKTLTPDEVDEIFGTNDASISGSTMTELLEGGISWTFLNRTLKPGCTYEVTISEVNADLTGYNVNSQAVASVREQGEESAVTTTGIDSVTFTLGGRNIANAEFTNSYERSDNKTVNFTKVWDDAGDKYNTRPGSLDVTLKATANINGEVKELTENDLGVSSLTKTISSDTNWKASWDVPVYYYEGDVRAKIDYSVSEGNIDSEYVYESTEMRPGNRDDYTPQFVDDISAPESMTSAQNTVLTNSGKAEASVQESSDENNLGAPEHNKYITYDSASGRYTLNLDVTGKKGDAAGVDVLFVIDTSGSMGSWPGWPNDWDDYYNLLPDVQELLTENGGIIDQIFAGEDNVNSVAYVAFAGTGETETSNWYSATSNIEGYYGLKSRINGLEATGGTNWTYAMQQASDLLDRKANDGNEKVVIFLSDGTPTYTMGYYEWHGDRYYGQTGDGNTTYNSYYNDAAKEVNDSASLSNAQFYSVYLVDDVKSGMETFSNKLSNSELVDGTSLQTAMAEILNKVIPTYKDVAITDTLSEYVVFADDNPSVTVTRQRNNGNKVTLVEGKDYKCEITDDTVKVSLLNGNSLEDGATYTVSFDVVPSEKANQEFAETRYNATGDMGTGSTSAGQDGFYSNDDKRTKLSYKIDGTNDGGDVSYPKPVIQVTTHVLTYEKQWNQPEGVEEPKEDVILQVTYSDGTSNQITLKAQDGYKATEVVPASKTVVNVTETSNNADYEASYQIDETGTKVIVTNNYVKATSSSVIVEKEWIDKGYEVNRPDSIEVALYQSANGEEPVQIESAILNEENQWTYRWDNLSTSEGNGEQLINYSYRVREVTVPEHYTSEIKYEYGDTITATITNTYDVNCEDEEYYIANILQKDEITLTKYWNDNNDIQGARPDEIDIYVNNDLYRLTSENAVDGNTWSKKIMLLEKKNAEYSASEELGSNSQYEQVDFDEIETANGVEFSFVNQIKTKSITIKKVWNDGEITARPGSVAAVLEYRTDSSADWTYHSQINITAENTVNGKPWSVIIRNLPINYEYRVTEISTAGGYNSVVTDSGDIFTITNTLKWSLKKTNLPEQGSNPVVLKGATFELRTTDTPAKLIATGTSGEDGMVTWTLEEDAADIDLNQLNGKYTITETVAPAGYQKLQTSWTLTFAEGLLTEVDAEEGYDRYIELTKDSANGVVITVKNSELYKLPSTGGPGIYLYMLGGVALMMAGTLLVYKKRKEEVLRS